MLFVRKCFLKQKSASMSRRTLVLADDELLIQRLVQPHLERAGFDTVIADNGVRAVELVMGARQPELIILDVVLPEIDGLAVLRLIKSTSHTNSIPVIIIGETYHAAIQSEAKSWGAVGFLTKPFSPAQLLAEINRVLGRRSGKGGRSVEGVLMRPRG